MIVDYEEMVASQTFLVVEQSQVTVKVVTLKEVVVYSTNIYQVTDHES